MTIKCIKMAIKCLEIFIIKLVFTFSKAMKWDEDKFGLEYDLDNFNLVAVRDFNYGAMENKSLNIFVSSLLLATKDTATDMDYQRVMGVIAHEYFHNWTGNRVTCRDWFQLTLKEGLTVYRDQEFSKEQGSAAIKRIDDVTLLRSRQFPEDAGPTAHPIRPDSYIAVDNFYTVTVYEKGAEVIRMYRNIVGEAGFRKGMDLYFKRHDGSAVTCDDFRAAMADANSVDLTQFERWYSQYGTPTVEVVESKYIPEEKKFRLGVRQTIPTYPEQPDPKPLHIPIAVGLIGKTSKKEIKATEMKHLKQTDEIFEFEEVEEDCVPSILRDFSAPVKLNHKVTDEDLTFLMAYDTDCFIRWEASQKMFIKLFLERYNSPKESEPLPQHVVDALKTLLTSDSDPALIARSLRPPQLDELLLSLHEADPCRMHRIRKDIGLEIRNSLLPELQNKYKQLSDEMLQLPYEPEPDHIIKRQLMDTCLMYICADRSNESADFALKHYKAATNLTDRMSALSSLIHCKGTQRDEALAHFLDSANGDEQVIDKWFALQARSDYDGLLDDVKKIKESHPLFKIATPPRARSLISVFAMNIPHFHKEDGSGYEFLADIIIEVNRFNAILGSRLCTFLINWKRFDKKRQELMLSQLHKISKSDGLSADAYELVSKSINQ
eukprot:GHVP01038416.1.p1 GENE.GHVP01038416.1~~GHVP01038416.1.p1  ORF type:complete len:662 (-),score=112.30 GHVP01038416.1:63-2048(-)